MGLPEAFLGRRWWADAPVNDGLFVRPDVRRNPQGSRRRDPNGPHHDHSGLYHDQAKDRGNGLWPSRSSLASFVIGAGARFAGPRFLGCCGGDFATISTARLKRCHALGFSSFLIVFCFLPSVPSNSLPTANFAASKVGFHGKTPTRHR